MGLMLSVYLLSAIITADKQTNKQTIQSFNYVQAPGLHEVQYYNNYMYNYKTVIIYNDANIL